MAVDTWTTDQVLAMLDQLGLSHVKQPFRDNGVNGSLLVALDETVLQLFATAELFAELTPRLNTELKDDLGLTHLQAKSVMMHLRSLGAYGSVAAAINGPVPGVATAVPTYTAPPAGAAAADVAAAQAAATRAAATAALGAAAFGNSAESAATQATQAKLQASNLLQRALGELQQAETILQQDKHLAGGMLAANVIAGPGGIGRHRGFGPGFDHRGIGGGIGDRRNVVTVLASVGEKKNAEAEQLTQVPQINPATVQSLKGGVYMNIIGGAFSQVVVRSKLQQSLASLRTMITQVRSAIDWLGRPRTGMY